MFSRKGTYGASLYYYIASLQSRNEKFMFGYGNTLQGDVFQGFKLGRGLQYMSYLCTNVVRPTLRAFYMLS